MCAAHSGAHSVGARSGAASFDSTGQQRSVSALLRSFKQEHTEINPTHDVGGCDENKPDQPPQLARMCEASLRTFYSWQERGGDKQRVIKPERLALTKTINRQKRHQSQQLISSEETTGNQDFATGCKPEHPQCWTESVGPCQLLRECAGEGGWEPKRGGWTEKEYKRGW